MSDYQRRPVMFHRKFCRPRVTVYRVPKQRPAFVWNRYDTATIGAAVVIGRHCVSLTWAKPKAEVLP